MSIHGLDIAIFLLTVLCPLVSVAGLPPVECKHTAHACSSCQVAEEAEGTDSIAAFLWLKEAAAKITLIQIEEYL